ncbi:MAG: 16S rRNA (adenine(1518)-N(6)/adenine(1519)-N(6))-dimethyltransferase RsmA [Hyphomicrobiaceae bacterium]
MSPPAETSTAFDGLPPLRQVIAELGLTAKRSLGQNFILDFNVTRRIARLAGPFDGMTVVEIGPGPGGLTRALLAEGAGRVLAVERDERCAPALHAIGAHYPGRLEVVFADALSIDWRSRVSGPVRLVANLPYNVATPLLANWLETEPWPPWYDRLVLMFQQEVGERIVATPHTKSYGRISILAQWRAEARIVMRLPARAFTPAPKVDSCLVEIRPTAQPEPGISVAMLSRVTAAAFGQRRKMLRSSLKTLTPDVEPLLAAAGIDPQARAEALSVADFVRLTHEATRLGCTPR